MSGVMSTMFSLIVGDDNVIRPVVKKGMNRRDLIRLESAIGRDLFGAVPAGHRREFFNLDENTWIWHEEWTDTETGKPQEITTRYEVHPNGILKVQDGQPYRFIDGEELQYFDRATQLYYERVMVEVYHCDPATGQPLGQSMNAAA